MKDIESLARAKAHHKNPGFINPWLPRRIRLVSFAFLKWAFSTNPLKRRKRPGPFFLTFKPDVEKILGRRRLHHLSGPRDSLDPPHGK